MQILLVLLLVFVGINRDFNVVFDCRVELLSVSICRSIVVVGGAVIIFMLVLVL